MMDQAVTATPAPDAVLMPLYERAREALATAVRTDEIRQIRAVGIAMRAYARQAKNKEMVADAADLTMRATRKLHFTIEKQRETVGLSEGGRPVKNRVNSGPGLPTLEDAGIDKRLAHATRRFGAMTDEEFEEFVADTKAVIGAATIGDKEVIAAARARMNQGKKDARDERERALGANLWALPDRKYGVILADPEWKFEVWAESGKGASADNHYPCSALDVIKARDVPSIAYDDCVLFLWATVPMLPQCLEVMIAWGFKYVSHFCWIKPKAGTGYWTRNKHELLLIGTKGSIPAPAMGTQFPSAFEAPTGKHSEKPELSYQMIEQMFPSLPRIELNARKIREGWDAWGNEAKNEHQQRRSANF